MRFPWLFVAITTLVAVSWTAPVWGRPRRAGRFVDRIALVVGGLEVLAVLALARTLVPWDVVPVAVWFALVAVLAGGVLGAARWWHVLPPVRPTHPRRAWAHLTLQGTIAAALVALAV